MVPCVVACVWPTNVSWRAPQRAAKGEGSGQATPLCVDPPDGQTSLDRRRAHELPHWFGCHHRRGMHVGRSCAHVPTSPALARCQVAKLDGGYCILVLGTTIYVVVWPIVLLQASITDSRYVRSAYRWVLQLRPQC